MDVSLDYALAHVDTNTISPWTNPVQWISIDANYIHAIFNELGLAKSDDIEQIGVAPHAMIYPVNLGFNKFLYLNAMELTVSSNGLVAASRHLRLVPSDALLE